MGAGETLPRVRLRPVTEPAPRLRSARLVGYATLQLELEAPAPGTALTSLLCALARLGAIRQAAASAMLLKIRVCKKILPVAPCSG